MAGRIAAVLVWLSVLACGVDDAAGEGATSVTVQTTEFAFEPAEVAVAADRDIEILVDNTGGAVEHDFALEEAGVVTHAAAGETATGTLTVAAGTYTYYCSIPGH